MSKKKQFSIKKPSARVDCFVTHIGVVYISSQKGSEHVIVRKGIHTRVAYCDND